MKDSRIGRRDVTRVLIDRSPTERYAVGLAAAAAAFLLRLSLDSLLGDKLPFAASVIATTLVAWYAGFGPSILTFVAGMLMANFFFIAPRHFAWDSLANAGPNVSTLIVGVTIILFGRSLHQARRLADGHARDAIAHQQRLEEEVKERKRAEEEVRQLNTELEKRVEQRTAELVASNEELESFTYSVSHDLRAPLRHVDGYAQMLEEEYSGQMSPEAQKYLKKIRRGSENMRQLVDDLLNLSHLGKAELSREPVELRPLAQAVARDLKAETDGRNVQWEIGELPVAECDAGLMRQVFANLLANAAKYTRPRAEARIEIGQLRTNGETAVFVRDNGVGFNMKYVNKLFGVFQRLHRSEEFEGTGVGLATVARIIRKHGGRVWAEGEPDKGATFYFTVSVSDRNGAEDAMPVALAARNGASAAVPAGRVG